jgi:methylase of polypeptide subunit release factors
VSQAQDQYVALVEKLLGDDRELDRLCGPPGAGRDALKDLYQQIFPRRERHALGEYYTPDWLAEHVLDELGYTDQRMLDPACGSGTFLVAAINRVRRSNGHLARGELLDKILDSVAGFDVNPLAVFTARANYRIAIRDLLPAGREVPVELRDSILDPAPEWLGRADVVAGNPPWIAWDHLPQGYRERTKPLWRHYGLFSLPASAARQGGGKKDLAALMLYAAADRYLRDGGKLGFVITQTLFQSRGAGDGFRRLRIGGDGPPLRIFRVDDMVRLRPFAGASNWTSVVFLQKGAPTEYPVRYVRWNPRQECAARPVDPARPSSPWIVVPQGERFPDAGPSDYQARAGAYSGGANGVYWLRVVGRDGANLVVENLHDCGKRAVESVCATIEPGLVYPLLRWGDVERYHARPSAHILLAQDPVTRKGLDEDRMRESFPLTYAYLQRFEAVLGRRRSSGLRPPFYSMFAVGPYTLAPIKVVWRRMDRRMNAAVVEGLIIPQETCVFIEAASTDEAHYLCATVNSDRVDALVRAHSVSGGKGFGTPGMLEFLAIRKYDAASAEHRELAAQSREAHQLAAGTTPARPCSTGRTS